jgi:guanylate kinase
MNKPLVYVLNGSGGCGKDTFVELCNKCTDNTIWHLSTITPIKWAAELLGWSGEKDEKSRKFLSDLKKLCTEAFDTSYSYIENWLGEAENDDVQYIFIDCREPKEIERLCKSFGAKSIYIDASKRNPIIISNHSDANVMNYNYDYYIDNNGTLEQFENNAKEFIQKGDELINGTLN